MSKLKTAIEQIRANIVTEINLNSEEIGDEGAKAIALVLMVNTSLSTLYLYGNKIGDEGAKDIALALMVNTSLSDLYLNGNQIGNEGTKDIAQALMVNTSVSTLYLRYSKIGDEGGRAIAQALMVNTSLSNLDLGGNQIGNEGGRAIREIIQRNKNVFDSTLEFIKQKFAVYDPQNPDSVDEVIKCAHKLKIYQKVSKISLQENLARCEDVNVRKSMSQTDQYIKDKFFTLTGISKHWHSNKGLFSTIGRDIIGEIIHHLGPQSLLLETTQPANNDIDIIDLIGSTDVQ